MFNYDMRICCVLIDFFIFKLNIIYLYKYFNCRDIYKFIIDMLFIEVVMFFCSL